MVDTFRILVALFTLCRFSTEAFREKAGKFRRFPTATNPPNTVGLFDCDFDNGYCGWVNDSTAEFYWYRTTNETPSKDTGPPWDHTHAGDRGEGYYVYIETSSPRQSGDHARLISPTIHRTGTFCLTFWHHMHGSDVKDLNVYLRGVRSHKTTMIAHLSGAWSAKSNAQTFAFGQDGDWWNEQNSEFTIDEPTKVVIEGIRGESYRGDIAVDDITLKTGKCLRKPIKCDFENNTCGWTQMSGDDFNWLPNRGSTATRDTGPQHDHTLGNPDGRYLYIESSWPRVEGEKARLLSPLIKCDKGAKPVFNFWYNMYGPHIGPLSVYMTKDEDRLGAPVWDKSGQQGIRWKLGQIPVPRPLLEADSFRIVIEAERKDYQGDTSIDDVSLEGCHRDEKHFGDLDKLTTATTTTPAVTTKQPVFARPPLFTVVNGKQTYSLMIPNGIQCNFDHKSLCSWQQDQNDRFDWVLNQGKTHSDMTGPSSDHTTRKGWYLYIEASSPRQYGDIAIIRSPPIPSAIHSCLSFYYHMKGKSVGRLEVLTARNGGNRFNKQWMMEGEQSNNETDWKLAYVDIIEAYDYQIIFRGMVGKTFYSDIAIDDITIKPLPCAKNISRQHKYAAEEELKLEVIMEPEGHDLDCTFTATTKPCNWTQVGSDTDEFDWTIARGSKTPSTSTGPSSDHTTGSRGSYAFIESSTPRLEGDRAMLKSPVFEIRAPMCFHLWYQMHGEDIGQLTVYRKSATGSSLIKLWSRTGNRGNVWLEALIDVRKLGKMNLYIEAKRGGGWRGDIAIDDLRMVEEKCESFDCDFEDGNCGWKNDVMQDDFDWIKYSGPTKSKNTGPSVDRTTRTKNGSYLFIEASNPRVRGDKARLISPIVVPDLNAQKCLTFWYHSFGEDVGAINVYKKHTSHKQPYLRTLLWYDDRNQGDQWLFTKIRVNDQLPYQIVIEGVRGKDYRGDMAIDDIQLLDEDCNLCCTDQQFKCGNHYCIHKSLRCNKVDDCGDMSDESFCDYDSPCGTPYDFPIVREFMEIPENIQHDSVTSIAVPLEDGTKQVEPKIIPERELGKTQKEEVIDVVKITENEIELIAHPRLGFELVRDTGVLTENGYESKSNGRRSETISILRRKRRSDTIRSTRNRRSTSSYNHNLPYYIAEFKNFILDKLFSIQSYFYSNKEPNVRDSAIYRQQHKDDTDLPTKNTQENDTEINFFNLLDIQKLSRKINAGALDSLTFLDILNGNADMEKRRTIQRTIGHKHNIPDLQWRLMTPGRKYITKADERRSRRSVKKIAGGIQTKQLNYPWQVAYYVTDSATKSHYFCGATLIDRYWIATAAHCPQLGDEHNIVVGDYDLFKDEGSEQECIVEAVYVNKNYQFSEDLVGDIALIQLRYPVKSSKHVNTACLLGRDDKPFLPNDMCVSTGWGRKDADAFGIERFLQQVEMPIIGNDVCQNKYWSIYKIHDSYVCAGGVAGNSCRGDSGGPLLCNRDDKFYLVGITSWGDKNCKANIPGVYTRVQSYTKWMEKIMQRPTCA